MAAKAVRARYKLLASMFTTYGYALTGGTALQTLLTPNSKLGFALIAGMVIGFVLQFAALIIVPRGEP